MLGARIDVNTASNLKFDRIPAATARQKKNDDSLYLNENKQVDWTYFSNDILIYWDAPVHSP